MPETAVDKQGQPGGLEDEIWFARQAGSVPRKFDFQKTEQGFALSFGTRPSGTHGAHDLASLGFCEDVRH
jgi:hypothetical protein